MKFFNGDCLVEMQKIADKSVDLILCDLPYGTTDCSWDSVIPFDKLWEQYNRIIKEDGVIALFASQPFTTEVINSNRKNYKYLWYWIKNKPTGFCFAKYQPMRCVEEILIFYKKFKYNPQGLKELPEPKKKNRKPPNDGVYGDGGLTNKDYVQRFTGYPKHTLYFDKEPTNKQVHPSQKPVDLLSYIIKTYTNEGDVVLDNCMGSGATGIACKLTKRDFIGIEMDEAFYNLAKKRIEETVVE